MPPRGPTATPVLTEDRPSHFCNAFLENSARDSIYPEAGFTSAAGQSEKEAVARTAVSSLRNFITRDLLAKEDWHRGRLGAKSLRAGYDCIVCVAASQKTWRLRKYDSFAMWQAMAV
jgi:hypothetical protein